MSVEKNSAEQRKRFIAIGIMAVAIVAAAVLFNLFVGGKFLTPQNFNNMMTAAAVPALVGWGLIFLFSSGITDLSAGAVIILASTMAGTLANLFGYVAMFIGGIVVGILCLVVNVTIFQVTKIPSWIAGLGMTMLYESIMGYYAQQRAADGQRVVGLESTMRSFGQAPLIYVAIVAGFILAYLVFNRTSIGFNARAVGDNAEVARMLGINTKKAMLLGAIMAGLFFGFAGVIKESYAGMVLAQTGLSSIGTIFQPLAAVLLAQALSKYINLVIAVPISTFIIAMVFNMLTLAGVPSGTFQEFLLGVIVIVFGVIAQRKVKGVVK